MKKVELFSLNDFRKWMDGQQGEVPTEKDVIGLRVGPRVGLSKLIDKMETDDDIYEVAREFQKEGGVISEEDGQRVMVETESGSFIIHKSYVKRFSS